MPQKKINNTLIDIDGEGFMTNPEQWTKEIAIEIAKEEEITLTDQHWNVIDFVRKDALENNGHPPTIRRINKVGGIPTKELYDLFPGGPGKQAAKISGYPKPVGCV